MYRQAPMSVGGMGVPLRQRLHGAAVDAFTPVDGAGWEQPIRAVATVKTEALAGRPEPTASSARSAA